MITAKTGIQGPFFFFRAAIDLPHPVLLVNHHGTRAASCRVGSDDHGDQRPAFTMPGPQRLQVDVGQHVGVDNQKRRSPQQRLRVLERAGGAQNLRLVDEREAQAPAAAVAKPCR